MKTLLQCIQGFIDNISVTDRQESLIDTSFKALKDRLLSKNNNLFVTEVFLNGSYERETMIRPLDDVDLFAVFDPTQYGNPPYVEPTPQSVLSRFKDYLNNIPEYKGKAKQDRPCITLHLSDKNFDILPALQRNLTLHIPNPELSGWMFTDPNTHTKNLNQVDKESLGLVKQVVKAVKKWKRDNDFTHFPSFHVEEIAIYVYNFTHFSNLEEGIRFWFSHAEGLLGGKVKTFEEYVEVKEKIGDVREKLKAAKTFSDQKKETEAIQIWKEVFGREFPALNADEAKQFSTALQEGKLKYDAVTGLSLTSGTAIAASKGFYGEEGLQ